MNKRPIEDEEYFYVRTPHCALVRELLKEMTPFTGSMKGTLVDRDRCAKAQDALSWTTSKWEWTDRKAYSAAHGLDYEDVWWFHTPVGHV